MNRLYLTIPDTLGALLYQLIQVGLECLHLPPLILTHYLLSLFLHEFDGLTSFVLFALFPLKNPLLVVVGLLLFLLVVVSPLHLFIVIVLCILFIVELLVVAAAVLLVT